MPNSNHRFESHIILSMKIWIQFNKKRTINREKRETLQQLPEINEKATYWLLPLINAVFKGYT